MGTICGQAASASNSITTKFLVGTVVHLVKGSDRFGHGRNFVEGQVIYKTFQYPSSEHPFNQSFSKASPDTSTLSFQTRNNPAFPIAWGMAFPSFLARKGWKSRVQVASEMGQKM